MPIHKRSLITGCILLLIGYAYYLIFRGFDPLALFTPIQPFHLGTSSFTVWGSLPTFLHTSAFCLLTYGLLSGNPYKIASFWLLINLLFEVAQLNFSGIFYSGTFSLIDMSAAIFGSLFFILFVLFTYQHDKQSDPQILYRRRLLPAHINNWVKVLLVFLGVFSITASYEPFDFTCDDCYTYDATPIYMSYEDLRNPLTIQLGRPLNQTGKIYSYNSFLFVNERNEGIHIYDNTNPLNPASKGFIKLPGNLDIAIKNGFLYADSFIDLVVIDLNNPAEPSISKRIEDIFPYDAYQVINNEEDVYLTNLDKSKGVVIGYIKEGE